MVFDSTIDTIISDDIFNFVNKGGDFFQILERVASNLGKTIVLEGRPSQNGKMPTLKSKGTYRSVLKDILLGFGYEYIFSDCIICVKNYSITDELPDIGYEEIKYCLNEMSKMLKHRGYYPIAPGTVDENFKSMFLSLSDDGKNRLVDSQKSSGIKGNEVKESFKNLKTRNEINTEDLKGIFGSKSFLSIKIKDLTKLQIENITSCIDNTFVNQYIFNLERGCSTVERVMANRSEFHYVANEYFISLVNTRKSNGTVYNTAISPVSKIYLDFTSSVLTSGKLDVKDYSDPDKGDYLDNGDPKLQYIVSEKHQFKIKNILSRFYNEQKILNSPMDDRILSIVGEDLKKKDLVGIFNVILNYEIIENERGVVLGFHEYQRSLKSVPLKKFIDYFLPSQIRRFYDSFLVRFKNISTMSSDAELRVDLAALHSTCVKNIKDKCIRQFRINFDHYIGKDKLRVVSFKELPEKCKDLIIFTFCIDAFSAVERIRFFEKKTIDPMDEVELRLYKSYKNSMLDIKLINSSGQFKSQQKGIIMIDS